MAKRSLFALFLLIFSISLKAQRVDTIAIFSPAMQREINNVVILPEGYEQATELPVLYLLHGYGGNHKTWLDIKPNLPELASRYGMIIVCPDGSRASWYVDSRVNPDSQYESYISSELIAFVDSVYPTRRDPSGRAITGLSMGGFGAMWNAINHQDVFGSVGSTSGGVDVRPFPGSWEMTKIFGEYAENPEVWDAHAIVNILHKIRPGLNIIIDCGTDDFFFPVNTTLHDTLLYRNIKHDFITRPGAHNAPYWNNSIDYQLLFFNNAFAR